MNKPTLAIVLWFFSVISHLAAESLDAGTELAIDPPWATPIPLGPLGEGTYHLEAATLAGDPVEFVLEKAASGGTWAVEGTNRTIQGAVGPGIDLGAADTLRRVRPVGTVTETVVLRLRQTQFATLRDSVKQGLTLGPATTAPLHLRSALPGGTGGPGLAATVSPTGTLAVGWLTEGGWGVEIWDPVQGQRIGDPIKVAFPASALALDASQGLVATVIGSGGTATWAWSGGAWVPQTTPAKTSLTTPWGTFRTDVHPVRVLQAKATGWLDLALPRDDAADLILLGSTDDGLAAFLASTRDGHRGFYLWKPGQGWTALVPPPATGSPWQELWAVTSGAGTLYHLEGRDKELLLRPFDGTDWHPALDLSPLAPAGARSAFLLPPSKWSKTGTLVLATDHVAVYDLP